MGLYAAVMIKDNHLAHSAIEGITPAVAVERARQFLRDAAEEAPITKNMIVEVEVDRIDQLRQVIPANPDIVLLDNMNCQQLRECVCIRNEQAPMISLEASGGVTLDSVKEIAETGVDRISVGTLTHSATNFDVGLDWKQLATKSAPLDSDLRRSADDPCTRHGREKSWVSGL